MPSLGEHGNWILLANGLAHELREAWWGEIVSTNTIRTLSAQPPVDVSPQSPEPIVDEHTTANIDQTVSDRPLGKILLRQEYVTAVKFVESYASEYPSSGVVVSGQPGIGNDGIALLLLHLMEAYREDGFPVVSTTLSS